MKQIMNPFLPISEYVPDGEPHVFGDRVYLYGSHDRENGDNYCLLDYVCYSAPVGDLSDWKYEGVIYKKEQDPLNREGKYKLFAPDVCRGPDGGYYLFYCLNISDRISVARSSRPEGPFEFKGYVTAPDGELLQDPTPFDPAVLNDKGKIYLYFGFCPTQIDIPGFEDKKSLKGCSYIELEEDMLTAKTEPKTVLPSQNHSMGTPFEGHEYFEGPSIRKVGNLFYLVYSSVRFNELCYAVSSRPDGGFKFQGTIVSNGDVGYKGRKEEDKLAQTGNNHGGMEFINGRWYIFYHRHTHGHEFSRQACAEPISIDKNGKIAQVEITTSGLNGAPLKPLGNLSAAYCCNLTDSTVSESDGMASFITSEGGIAHVAHVSDGTKIGFKYFTIENEIRFFLTYRGKGEGKLYLNRKDGNGEETFVSIKESDEWINSEPVVWKYRGVTSLVFEYRGRGSFDFASVTFS